MKAIIFDMDGVIVDTEIIDYDLQIKYLKENNPNIKNKDYKYFSELVGLSYKKLFRKMSEFLNHSKSIETIEKEYTELEEKAHNNLFYKNLLRYDVIKILDWAKSCNIKLAVVSSSTKIRIINVLKACDILKYFDLIVSGEDFEESKPNPDIYLTALKKLQKNSEDVVVIEDSYYGIEASKNAFITTIAYKEKRLGIKQSHADYIFNNMTEILTFLKSNNSILDC